MNSSDQSKPIQLSIEIAIYLGLIFVLLAWCLQIITPFVSLIAWATIIAVSIFKPFIKLRDALGGRKKLAVTIITVLGLAAIIIPFWLFTDSLVTSVKGFSDSAQAGTFVVPPPSENVQEWPLIGERVYSSWSLASRNLEGWLSKNSEQLSGLTKGAASAVAGMGIGVLQFVASMLIAAFFLSNAEDMRRGALRFSRRVAQERGEEFLDTTVATIRSVTVGVLGIAVIQAIFAGAGMLAVGVPAAGLIALIVAILAVAQLPPMIVLLPVIVYVFSVESTTVASVFAVWSIVVGSSDTFLKPMLLGRGVDTPMLVVLLGAIGGMIVSGIIGLFVGAIILTLGYTLMELWLSMGDADDSETSGSAT
jgi:predicted PurR-regulated permease PerM